MSYLASEFRQAISLLGRGDPYLLGLVWVTLRVAVISTVAALLIGLPAAVTLGTGRFRGRSVLHALANASLALPPVVVGLFVLLLLLPHGVLGGAHIAYTLTAVYVAQTVLALPYIVALGAAALRGLPSGLLAQARAFGADRSAVARLALREARIGILAAVIAAFGSSLAEVGAVVMVGGNVENHDQTLASAVLQQVNDYADYPYGLAMALVLLALVLVLMVALSVVQHRDGGLRLRFREG